MFIVSSVIQDVKDGSKLVKRHAVKGSKAIANTVYNRENVYTGLAYAGLGLYVGFCLFVIVYGLDNTMKQNKLMSKQLKAIS